MSPLNFLINYSAKLTHSEASFTRHISSRFLATFCIPVEMLASLENMIRLPFQCAALTVKIPAKLLNVVFDSMSLREFETQLAGPLDILKTALKIVGYAVGIFFTASLGALISPLGNFKLHCAFGLISDEESIHNIRLADEKKQNEIANQQKIIETRLKKVIEAKRKNATPFIPMTPDQLNQIETLTQVPCLPINEVIGSPPLSLSPVINPKIEEVIDKVVDEVIDDQKVQEKLEEVIIESEQDDDFSSEEIEKTPNKTPQQIQPQDVEQNDGIDLENPVTV